MNGFMQLFCFLLGALRHLWSTVSLLTSFMEWILLSPFLSQQTNKGAGFEVSHVDGSDSYS